jgi:hypothetical protein
MLAASRIRNTKPVSRDVLTASAAQRADRTDYVAQISDGDPARCNPINTGPHCRDDALERLH